ncbi:putative Integrase core domain [Cucumis melo var. makuwa]|uniref:Integrase core domain n=1 Tax=Cucumis melo var. makuwa TaxID=1194695 RepID=A0A5A7UDD2_CUCMM|nr:putative Integrase core domain [Cucumis melo var. makuwa]
MLMIPKSKEPKPSEEGECYHYKENWALEEELSYLEERKKNKESVSSTSDIFVIEVNLSASNPTSWVLDTKCGAQICGNVQGLRSSRTLDKCEVDL